MTGLVEDDCYAMPFIMEMVVTDYHARSLDCRLRFILAISDVFYLLV